jgi:hypothetical protein
MKLHTSLTDVQVSNALYRARLKGLVAPDVYFTVFVSGRSRTHPHGYKLQLGADDNYLPPGTTDQHSKRMRVRRTRAGQSGAARYAATWYEWGWLITEIFTADPGARWGSDPARAKYAWGYFSPEDFHVKTDGQFRLVTAER